MLHVPLHITKVNDVGGVSLWVSSVFWDTNSLCQALRYYSADVLKRAKRK